MRATSAISLLLLAGFAVAMALAAFAYPGGSYHDRNEVGFSLLHNHWCDLLRDPAHDGSPNLVSSRLAKLAFAAFGLALVPFWLTAGVLLAGVARLLVPAMGAASALLVMLVGQLSSDRFPTLHGVISLSGAGLGMLAVAWSLAACTRADELAGVRRLLGGLSAFFCLSNALLYAHVAYLGGSDTLLMPLAQKLATGFTLAWMLSTLRSAWCLAARAQPEELRGHG